MTAGPQPFPLPSDTRHLNIESRQYKLLGVDLGHGWPRAAFKVGAVFFLPWLILCWRLGLPLFTNGALLLWLGPPLFVTRWAFTRDHGGRYRIYSWIDRMVYLLHRPRPIVNGGLADPGRPTPIRSRIAFLITHEDLVPTPHEEVVDLLPDSIRDDFTPTRDTQGAPRAQVA